MMGGNVFIYNEYMDKTCAIERSKMMIWTEIIFFSFAFLVPLIFSGPQIIVGSVVNTLLFIGANVLDKKKILVLIALPSSGALGHGVFFGPQTYFLFYFLPFIWIGNGIMVGIYRENKLIGNSIIRIILSCAAKALFLYMAAVVYFSFHIVPHLFVVSMGMVQLETALIGGLLALIILKMGKIQS